MLITSITYSAYVPEFNLRGIAVIIMVEVNISLFSNELTSSRCL